MHKLMKYLVATIFTLVTLPALALDDAVNTGFFNNTAIEGYDTVAYFTQGKPVEGNKKFQVIWRDANWRFSSQKNLELFKQNPEMYAAQYGGYCAWAMADSKTAGIDPNAWHIQDGKLYLNYNQKIKKDWLSTIDADIVSANKYYSEITNVKQYQDN